MNSPRLLFLASSSIYLISFFFPVVKMYDDTGYELILKTVMEMGSIDSLDSMLYIFLVIAPNLTVPATGLAIFLGYPCTAVVLAAAGYLISLYWSYFGLFLGIRIGHMLWHIGELGVLVAAIWNLTGYAPGRTRP